MFVFYVHWKSMILLREVSTEEEAFAEMRRFNEVNHVHSRETEIRWLEAHEDKRGATVAPRKIVTMTTEFGICYDSSLPMVSLGDESKWGIKRENFVLYNPDYHFNPSLNKFVCWYDEVKAYLEDLEHRKGGE